MPAHSCSSLAFHTSCQSESGPRFKMPVNGSIPLQHLASYASKSPRTQDSFMSGQRHNRSGRLCTASSNSVICFG